MGREMPNSLAICDGPCFSAARVMMLDRSTSRASAVREDARAWTAWRSLGVSLRREEGETWGTSVQMSYPCSFLYYRESGLTIHEPKVSRSVGNRQGSWRMHHKCTVFLHLRTRPLLRR